MREVNTLNITMDQLEILAKVRECCRELDGLDASFSRYSLDIVLKDEQEHQRTLDVLIRERQIKFDQLAELIWPEE